MGQNINNQTQKSVNDIWHCLEDAQVLASQFKKTQRNEKRIFRAFTTLAQDESVGFLAYVIWKGRGQGLSSLRIH
jgi:hypothetical protein